MPKAKLSDAQAIPDQSTTASQGGTAKLSDATPVPEKDPVVDKWNTLSRSQRDNYFQSLPAAEQARFASRVGMFNSQEPVGVSAAPSMGSVPWMKQKAYSLANWGVNQIPNAEAAVGGFVGGLLGEVAVPAGGGLPGSVLGAGLGGASGEKHRQQVVDSLNMDPYAKPETMKNRLVDMRNEGLYQAGAELAGAGTGKLLRPTLERSLSKLYYAGKFRFGNFRGPGDLERVVKDLMATEKAGSGKATTVGDLYNVINQTKKDIGQKVDLQYALPIQQNGRTVLLGQAHADSTPIVNAINSKLTADPSVVKLAGMNKSGPEAAYLERVKKEALNFQQHPWTYSELADRRIHLNQEIQAIYSLPPGEQRMALLASPDLAYKKAEADAIREIIYPKMDALSNNPLGTTEAMQEKRGSLMSLENQLSKNIEDLKTTSRQVKGAPPSEKVNASGYITSSGKPGGAIHRATSLIHTPNVEARANKQVARAFGNTIGSKVLKGVTTPLESAPLGNQIMTMPLQMLIHHPTKFEPALPPEEDEDTSEPQSSVTRPKDLIEKAKQLNPSAQGQNDYTHVAVNPANGHRIGSPDGTTWFDVKTGTKVV